MSRVSRRQIRRQKDLSPPPVRTPLDGPGVVVASGTYLRTSIADNWKDRIVVHGLADQIRSTVFVADSGVLFTGVGAGRELWIPVALITGARSEFQLNEKTAGASTALVVSWRWGVRDVETLLTADDPSQHESAAQAILRAVRAEPAQVSIMAPVAEEAIVEEPVVVPAPVELFVPEVPELPVGRRVSAPALLTGARPVVHLLFEDGRAFAGQGWGAAGSTTGEAVFCTGMTGYQETITDPSYAGQVVVQAAPHIGNTGVNDEDAESRQVWVAGYVVRDRSPVVSNWRSRGSLDEYLATQGVVCISDLDTRAVVRHLRDNGSMRCAIGADLDELRVAVLAAPSMTGQELASSVSTIEPYVVPAVGPTVARVAALDLGIKGRTPWHLAQRGVEVHVMPARTSAQELLALQPDGVFFSNGPGDPAATIYAHETLREILSARVPFFGICLGNQILGHALGLGTTKLPFGHRGINHPVLDRATGRVVITSQNHGFAVEAPIEELFDTPFGAAEVSHTSLFDKSVEGLRCRDIPAFSVQYHPEAAAGPHDGASLFDDFLIAMTGVRA